MEKEKFQLYFVSFKFRLKRKFKTERWKPRYRWQRGAVCARCYHLFQVEELVKDKILENQEGQYQIKIVEVSRVKIQNQEAADQSGIKC